MMKQFFSFVCGIAFFATASTANAQIEWAAGAPGGTSGGSIELIAGDNIALATGISAAQVAPTTGADYTISAWINSSEDDGAGNATANRWWFGTGNRGLHLGVQTATSGLTTGHWGNDSTAATTVSVNTWVHATHVYRAGVQEIYLNGVLDSSVAAGAPNNDSTDLQIGSRNGGGGPSWGGLIDDVAIFNSALSVADIATLAGDSSQAVALGAVAYYNFEDAQTGTTAANLVSVATSGLTGTDGSPALQQLDGIGAELPPVADWTAGAPGGTPGGAVSFAGTGFLSTGISATLVGGNRADGTLGSDYTVSAWILSGVEGVDEFDTGTGNAADNHWWFGTGNRGIHFGIFGDDTFPQGTLQQGHWSADSSGATVVPVETWVHATYTYDADGGTGGTTGLSTIYYNGVFDSSAEVAAPDQSGTDLIIGARSGGRDHWVGSIDDVAIFTSVLSTADVATLAADSSQAVTLGAAAYYNFEDSQAGGTAANLVSVATSGLTGTDGSPAFQELTRINPSSTTALCGDVNLDTVVNFLDISPFISVLSAGAFQAEADCNEDGVVSFLDISPFIVRLSSQ